MSCLPCRDDWCDKCKEGGAKRLVWLAWRNRGAVGRGRCLRLKPVSDTGPHDGIGLEKPEVFVQAAI